MADQTHDVGELAATARAVDGIATTAATDTSTAVSGVAERRQVWGTDATGGAFAEIYLAPAAEVMGAVVQTAYQIGEIAELLGANTQAYQETEAVNVGASHGGPTAGLGT